MRLRKTESRTALSKGCPLRVVAAVVMSVFVFLCLGASTRNKGGKVVKDRVWEEGGLDWEFADISPSRTEVRVNVKCFETPRKSSRLPSSGGKREQARLGRINRIYRSFEGRKEGR